METVNGVRITCLPGSGGIVLSYYAQDCPPQEKMARIQAILYRKDGTNEEKVEEIREILEE